MFGHRKIRVYEDNGTIKETEVFLPQIRDVIGFLEGVWDLNIYADCFEGKNKLGDVDASIELYGWTLHIEFKRSRNDLNAGQVVKAIRQARHSNITTIFVFGETNRPKEYLMFEPDNLDGSGIQPTNVIELRKLLKKWAAKAKENSLVKRTDRDWAIAKKYVRK